MSNDRETIFSAIRKALDPLPERTPYPEWAADLPVCQSAGQSESIQAEFAQKLTAASSRYLDSIDALRELLLQEQSTFGYCDPALAAQFEGMEGICFETEYDLAKIDDYTFGITRASAGIAESGTIMLKDGDTSARLGALAPWVHVAVLQKQDLLATLPQAIERFGDDPSIIWATGPSKTADVEGILIEGVHGPGIQVALVL